MLGLFRPGRSWRKILLSITNFETNQAHINKELSSTYPLTDKSTPVPFKIYHINQKSGSIIDPQEVPIVDYMTSAEASQKWQICPCQVQRLLTDKRIPFAKKMGRVWLIRLLVPGSCILQQRKDLTRLFDGPSPWVGIWRKRQPPSPSEQSVSIGEKEKVA
jgi:hypothetical protein